MEKLYSGLICDLPDSQKVKETFDAVYDLVKTGDIDKNDKNCSVICAYGYAERMQAFQRGLAIGMSLASDLKEVTL